MHDEPRRHRLYMLLLGTCAVLTAPFPFIGAETRMIWGLPLWLWWSFAFTTVFAGMIAWGILVLWRGDAGD